MRDEKYPETMWRVRMPDGSLSDMVNKTRARDAARSIASAIMKDREKPKEVPAEVPGEAAGALKPPEAPFPPAQQFNPLISISSQSRPGVNGNQHGRSAHATTQAQGGQGPAFRRPLG